MSDDLEKGLDRSKRLLSEMRNESGLLYDALTSIGTNIGYSIENAIEGMSEMDDIGKAIANTYKKDITNSIKASARDMDKLVNIQIKLNKKQNASKQIQDALDKLAAKKIILSEKLNGIGKNQVDISAEEGVKLMENLTIAEEILEKKLKENTENQKGKTLLELTLNPLKKLADKIDSTGTLSKIMSGNFKDTVTYSRAAQLSAASMVNFLIKAVVELDKLQTGLNRQFGFTDKTAMKLQVRFQNIAKSSKSNFITFKDIHKTMAAITDVTGVFAGTLRGEVLEGAARALELMDLSGESVARLAFNAQRTGQSFENQNLSMASGLILAEKTVGVTLDSKKAFQEAANATGLIRANLGRNYQHIVNTVGQAQALGLTLQDLAGISSNLLNFQSSIEAELTAELFTGKQLNLEKARLYALTGDYNNLQKEIMKNVGSEYEFLSMNVLPKEKYAAALGMSVDKMSNLVMKNADLAAIEQQAREGGRQDIVDEMQKLTLQKEFSKIIEKVQTTFIEMANPDGGLAAVANIMSSILGSTTSLHATLGAIIGLKFGSLILQMMSLAAANGAAATSALALKFLQNPIAGLMIAAGLGAVLAVGIGSMKKATAEPIVETKLARGALVTQETQAIIGEAGPEGVFPLTAFYGKFDEMINATKDNKQSQQWEWEENKKWR